MSLRNTPNFKNTATKPSSTFGTKFSTPSSSTPVKPARTTLSTTKKLSTNSSVPRPGIVKQTSACDLRERLHLNSEDVLNTGFASTPPISRLPKSQSQSKSKLATANNLYGSNNALSSASSVGTIGFGSTNKSTAKQLFGSSTPNLYETANRTPECFTKVSADTPTPRNAFKTSGTPCRSHRSDEYTSTDSKTKDSAEVSNLTVAVRVRPMNAKECETPSVINVITVDANEVSVLAGTNGNLIFFERVY